MESEWQIENSCASFGKFKRFARKHAREYESLFANLDKIIRILRGGNKILGFRVDFFRSEGGGVYRIGQTAVRGSKESRLYVFPDEPNRICYILSIGDKSSQSDDINEAKNIVKQIKSKSVQKQ